MQAIARRVLERRRETVAVEPHGRTAAPGLKGEELQDINLACSPDGLEAVRRDRACLPRHAFYGDGMIW
jgi:hypothetical protein